MRLLLDTHIAVWAGMDDPRLEEIARQWLMTETVEPVISIVTLWEISIKHALGPKRRDPMPLQAGERIAFSREPVTP